MREIKFRAWDAQSKNFRVLREILYDTKSKHDKELKVQWYKLWGSPFCDDGECNPNILVRRKPNEVLLLQYTGLKDKNGVEIYEGDIVKCNGFISDIKWSNSTGYKIVDRLTCRIMKTKGYSYLGSRSPICEVIGNIYEHPHLLHVKETE